MRSKRKGGFRISVILAPSLCMNFRINQDFLLIAPQLHWNFENTFNLEINLGRNEGFTWRMNYSFIQITFYVLQQSFSFLNRSCTFLLSLSALLSYNFL